MKKATGKQLKTESKGARGEERWLGSRQMKTQKRRSDRVYLLERVSA